MTTLSPRAKAPPAASCGQCWWHRSLSLVPRGWGALGSASISLSVGQVWLQLWLLSLCCSGPFLNYPTALQKFIFISNLSEVLFVAINNPATETDTKSDCFAIRCNE